MHSEKCGNEALRAPMTDLAFITAGAAMAALKLMTNRRCKLVRLMAA